MQKPQKNLVSIIKYQLALLIFLPNILHSQNLTKIPSTEPCSKKDSEYKDVSCVNVNNKLRCVALCPTQATDVMHYTNDGGKTWLKQFELNNTPSNYGYELRAVNCTSYQSKPLCIGIGVYYTLGHELHTWTFIIRNEDGSSLWIDKSPVWMQFDHLTSIKCFPSGLCVASGSDVTIESMDSGYNWSKVSRANVQCTLTANKTTCLAIDYDEPTILISEESSSAWKTSPIQNFPINSSQFSITALSCSNKKADGICVLVGKYKDAYSRKKPFILQSTDGAKTWSYQNADANFPNGVLNAVSCSQTNKPTVCAAVGERESNKPLIVQTTNGGVSWQIKSIEKDPLGILKSIYCGVDKHAVSHICTSVGSHLAAQSDGNGKSWHLISLNSNEQNYNKITCVTNNEKELCVVAGTTLIQSQDGRKTWHEVEVK